MYGSLSISAEEVFERNSRTDGTYTVLDPDRVQLSFPAEDGYEPTCTGCGETIAEYPDGWQDNNGMTECEPERPHEPEQGPGTWINSAAITVDEDDNAVHVSISFADPRGAFSMTLRKTDDGTILLHVPHPDSGWLHAPLTELHPGTYRVGS